MSQSAWSRFLRYGCAVVSVLLMTGVRLLLPVSPLPRLMAFFFAVIFTAWYGGLGPSVLAVALACLLAAYVFIPPYYSLTIGNLDDFIGLGMFVAVCAAIIAFSEVGRAARRKLEQEIAERRRAEQSEREQRERYQTTLSCVGEGVIVTDAWGRVVSLNPIAEGMTGWITSEAAGRTLKDVFRTVDQATNQTDEMPLAAVVRDEVPPQMKQSELVSRGGPSLPIEHCAAPIRDKRGAVTGVVIVFRDITVPKRLEEALQQRADELARLQARTAESLALLDTVYESSPVGLAYLDRGLRYRRINSALASIDGRPGEEHLGRTLREVFPGLADLLEPQLRRVLETGEPMINQELGGKIGSPCRARYWLASYFPVRAGDGVVGVGLAAVEISDRKWAEQALRESEEQYRAVYSQAATGIAEADLGGRIVRANDRFCEIAGYPRDELIGLRFGDITHPDDRAESVDPFRRLIHGGPCYTIEKRYVRKDGATVWARVAVSMIRDGSGRPARIVAVIEEISERKRLEDELRRRVEELAHADRRKDEFLATLAHELRNPLAPIRNALHLMRSPNGDAHGIETDRAMAERQVVHLARLIDDLMDVARIGRGKIELRKEVLDVAAVIRRAIESVRSALEERRHELTLALPDAPVRLEADPTRLEQVLWNLLNNAIKYTEPGGSIRIEVVPEGDEVAIRVRDTGVGIEPAMLPKVFDMFVQAGHSAERAQGGLGIGLSLVKTLVELHGGRVGVGSDGRGRGTEFVVRLPVLVERPGHRDEPTVRAVEAGSRPQPPRRRVLVVDDNIDAATSLARLLSRIYGQEVRVAHDGPGALQAAEEFHPELVLLDIGMPGMDGYEVARQLRLRPGFEGTLLVALTGWGQESDRDRSREAGFDHHLVKPVDPDALLGLLPEPSPSALGRP